MKKNDISRLEYWRPISLRIGYAVSLALIVLAFSWTTERPTFEDPQDDFVENGDVEIIPATKHPEKKKLPPPPKAKPINFEIMPTPNPIEPYDPSIIDPIEPEPVIGIPKPVVKPEPIFEKPKEKVEDLPFIKVEEMPRFDACEAEEMSRKEKEKCAESAMLQFIYNQIRYPAIARENGVEGMVVIRFVVEKNGSISNAQILREIGAGCGVEALRVVNTMPDWIPGKQRGHKVRVQYNLPVRFRLH